MTEEASSLSGDILEAMISDGIIYKKDSPFGPYVQIPLARKLARGNIDAIVADFVSSFPAEVVEKQTYIDATNVGDQFTIQYFVVNESPKDVRPLSRPANYRIFERDIQVDGKIQIALVIARNFSCTHDSSMLENYAAKFTKMLANYAEQSNPAKTE